MIIFLNEGANMDNIVIGVDILQNREDHTIQKRRIGVYYEYGSTVTISPKQFRKLYEISGERDTFHIEETESFV